MHSKGKMWSLILFMSELLSVDQTKSGSPAQSSTVCSIPRVQSYAESDESARSKLQARCDIGQGYLVGSGPDVEHLRDRRVKVAQGVVLAMTPAIHRLILSYA